MKPDSDFLTQPKPQCMAGKNFLHFTYFNYLYRLNPTCIISQIIKINNQIESQNFITQKYLKNVSSAD